MPKSSQSQKIRFKTWLWAVFAIFLFLGLFTISSLSMLRVFLPYYPELTGFPFGERNYLIVFQDNNELRPTGGVITFLALANFHNGFTSSVNFEDIYDSLNNHKNLNTPEPLKELLAEEFSKGHTFHVANHSPDFPTSAEEIIKMFNATHPKVKVDGVIALNYSFIRELIRAIGPVKVETKVYTADNLFENLEYEVRTKHIENVEHQGNILKKLYYAIKTKIFWNPFLIRKVSDTLIQAINAQEIQFYFKNPNLKKITSIQGWEHAWSQDFEGDFLAVVESNVSGLKTNRYMQKNVIYKLKVEEDSSHNYLLTGDVSVDIYYHGNGQQGAYKGFFRTYIPQQAKILNERKNLWKAQENNFQVLGDVVKLNPGESAHLHYKYSLPSKLIKDKKYSLLIPKQSGNEGDFYTVIVQLPQGLHLQSNRLTSKENTGSYQGILTNDLHIDFQILPDYSPPYVISKEISSLNHLTIVFNEKINPNSITTKNIKIKDQNKKNKKLDNLSVKDIEIKENELHIFLKGMTYQPKESYELVLDNIQDVANNVLEPTSRTLTLTQKL